MSRASWVTAGVAIVGAAGWLTVTGVTDTTGSTAAGADVEVVRVVDGDTLDVAYPADETTRVRVLGIDSPETVNPNLPVQCWGPESSAWAQRVLGGETITLTGDPSQDDTDRYGRQLRYVTLPGGTDFSTLAVSEGMARAYAYGNAPLAKSGDITAAEDHAQSAGAGLWGSC